MYCYHRVWHAIPCRTRHSSDPYLPLGSGNDMTSGIFGSGLRIPPQVKRKVFISYHHLGDQSYYDAFS
jgi:hypothetical protein